MEKHLIGERLQRSMQHSEISNHWKSMTKYWREVFVYKDKQFWILELEWARVLSKNREIEYFSLYYLISTRSLLQCGGYDRKKTLVKERV